MKNALLIVLAFALGGGAMWYFTSDRSAGGPGAPAGAVPGPPAGGFGGGGRPAAPPALGTAGRGHEGASQQRSGAAARSAHPGTVQRLARLSPSEPRHDAEPEHGHHVD